MSADLWDLDSFYQPNPSSQNQENNSTQPGNGFGSSSTFQSSTWNNTSTYTQPQSHTDPVKQDVDDDDDWGAFETGEEAGGEKSGNGVVSNSERPETQPYSFKTADYQSFVVPQRPRGQTFDDIEVAIGSPVRKGASPPPNPSHTRTEDPFPSYRSPRKAPRDENVLFDADDEDDFGDFETAEDSDYHATPAPRATTVPTHSGGQRNVARSQKPAVQDSLIDFDADVSVTTQPKTSSTHLADFASLSFTDSPMEIESKSPPIGSNSPPAPAFSPHLRSNEGPPVSETRSEKPITPFFEEDNAWGVADDVPEESFGHTLQESSNVVFESREVHSQHIANSPQVNPDPGSNFEATWPDSTAGATEEISPNPLAINDDNPWDDTPRPPQSILNQTPVFADEEAWEDFQEGPPDRETPLQSGQSESYLTTSPEDYIPSAGDPWTREKTTDPRAPLQLPRILPPVELVESSAVPPTNIPPPGHLIPLFPPIFSVAQTNLFDPLAQQTKTSTERDRILGHHDTLEFLISYVSVGVVFARVIAGRKLRWKRDKILSQSMKIGPASSSGKSGGMKLTGIDKSETAREDREITDALAAWKAQVGRLRTTVSGAGGFATVPEVSENMPVRTAKPSEGAVNAPAQCALCGLKRNERVQKVDFDVLDSFGEWWVEHWGHRDCMRFWDAQKEGLAAR